MAKKDLTLLDAIRELKHQDPFEQFVIVTTSGDKYLIENPDNMAIGQSMLFYYFPGTNRFVFIRTSQMVAVERIEHKPAA